MATLNGERFIRKQLESLASQTFSPLELIVCDDGSRDATLEIVDEFAKSAPFAVRIHENAQRLGYADNFLKAASLSKGEWTAFCDQDDVWLPGKLEAVAAAIQRHPEVVLVAHPADLIDETGEPTGGIAWASRERLVPRFALPWSSGMGCGQVFRSSLVKGIPYERRFLVDLSPPRASPHDDWVLRLAQCVGSCFYLSESLVLRRRHPNSATGSREPPIGLSRSLPWRYDVTELLLKNAKLSADLAEVLALCAAGAEAAFVRALEEASDYFAEAARIFRARGLWRKERGMGRLHLALGVFTEPTYWRMGRGIVGWRGQARDLVDLFRY